MPAPIADSPPTKFGPFRGADTTIHTMRELCLGARGERSMLVRSFTEYAVRGLQPKDYLSEILACRNLVAERLRYVNDPIALELCKDPQRMVEEMNAHGVAAGDCDDSAMLLATMYRQLGRKARFCTVGFQRMNEFSHVFPIVQEPKSGKWIVTDTVAGTKEDVMLARVKTFKLWEID